MVTIALTEEMIETAIRPLKTLCDARAEQLLSAQRTDRDDTLHLLQRSRVQENDVQQQVNRGHKKRPKGQRCRQRSCWLPNLLSDVRGGIPATVRNIDPEETDRKLLEERGVRRSHRTHPEVRPVYPSRRADQQR